VQNSIQHMILRVAIFLVACSATLAGSQSCPVTQNTLNVTKTGNGSGVVESTPSGISCGTICNAAFTTGATILLTAKADAGSVFAGWSGNCSGATTDGSVGPLAANAACTAMFTSSSSTATAAPLGAPSTKLFNGLPTVQDSAHRVAGAAIDAARVASLTESTPYIPNIKLLGRRDSLIIYVPNVAGAADYRAYISAAGAAPTLMACAGYRQRAWAAKEDAPFNNQTPTVLPNVVRELLQAIELPGLTSAGDYTVVVEALASPCPFTGMPGHTSAAIAMAAAPLTTQTGGTIPITSYVDVAKNYGSEIVNGQGASSDWFLQAGQKRGQAASAAAINVIARSTMRVAMPFADEAVNAPIIDVGPNAVFDDFRTNAVATDFRAVTNRSFGSSKAFEGAFNNWYFLGTSAQAAVGEVAGGGSLGAQVWTRHGRLNITLADWAQDVFSAVHFSSLTTKPVAIDQNLYAHSFFRVDSGATGRRYWHWLMCGADDITTLVDPATNIPRIRHLLRPGFYEANGNNPTSPADGETLTPLLASYHNRECVNLLQLAASNPDLPKLADGSNGPAPAQTLIASINPANTARGAINLTPAIFNRGYGTPTINWRLDENNNYAGPIIEPFDQQAPLTHFDVFVKSDRMVLFINGRQAVCWDMKARPLAMRYGHILYGQVLYHSNAEVEEYYLPKRTVDKSYQPPIGLFHYTLNTPAADHRAWDAVGHTEKIEIPALFKFNEKLCKVAESYIPK
jgi:Divergent InlB B-repeat domain